jgi:hypothetical protein
MYRTGKLFARLLVVLTSVLGSFLPLVAHAQSWAGRSNPGSITFLDGDSNQYTMTFLGIYTQVVRNPTEEAFVLDDDNAYLVTPKWLCFDYGNGFTTPNMEPTTPSNGADGYTDSLEWRLLASAGITPLTDPLCTTQSGPFWYVWKITTTANIPTNSEIIVRLKQGANHGYTYLFAGGSAHTLSINVDGILDHVQSTGTGIFGVNHAPAIQDTSIDLFPFVRLINYSGTRTGYVNMNAFLYALAEGTPVTIARTTHAIVPVAVYGHPGTGAPKKVLAGTITRDQSTPPGDKGARRITFEFIPASGPSTKRDVMLEDNGDYAIPADAIGNGTYNIAIQGLKTLRKVVTSVSINSAGSTVTLNATLIEGDINFDNSVDILDLADYIVASGSVEGDANYNPMADLNFDGSVDGDDEDIIMNNFDEVGD